MDGKVFVRELWKEGIFKNRFSGHSWGEPIRLIAYEVAGPYGVIVRVKTREEADKLAEEWQAFYDKYPFNP